MQLYIECDGELSSYELLNITKLYNDLNTAIKIIGDADANGTNQTD